MRRLLILLLAWLAPAQASAQALFDAAPGKLAAPGWAGFQDYQFMTHSLGALLLAIVLGAVIGYHPMTPRTIDTLREADMPKVFIMYAFVGCVIGVTVGEFGMVIGFVVFGIGGLLRFRTDTESARETGRLIAVTLAGLIAGLGLPHLAVIVTLFAFALIFMFDSHPTCRVKVSGAPQARLADSAAAYRAVLQQQGCKILGERTGFDKGRVEFIFRLPRSNARDRMDAAFGAVPAELRGEVAWEVE